MLLSFQSDLRSALAICAAIIGAGFASGREIVSFFSGLGSASYAGTAAASAAIGALIYVIIRLSIRTQAASFPDLYGALMGSACRDAMHILYALLCLTASAAMLSAGAHMGELTFDSRFSHLLGLLLTLTLGILSVCKGMRSLSLWGGVLVPLIALYYLSMALSGTYPSEFAPETIPAVLPMGILYAAFNTALSGGAICLTARKNISPKRTALLTGGILFALLSCANAALLQGGDAVRRSALPSVALAARWGILGYYFSIAVIWLSVLTTLCALLCSLRSQLSAHLSPAAATLLSALGSLALSLCGFDVLIDVGYPLLGWICCCALIGLVLFLPEERVCFTLRSDKDSK